MPHKSKRRYNKQGTQIKLMNTGTIYEVVEVGVFVPNYMPVHELKAGDVGYITASIKNVRDVEWEIL